MQVLLPFANIVGHFEIAIGDKRDAIREIPAASEIYGIYFVAGDIAEDICASTQAGSKLEKAATAQLPQSLLVAG